MGPFLPRPCLQKYGELFSQVKEKGSYFKAEGPFSPGLSTKSAEVLGYALAMTPVLPVDCEEVRRVILDLDPSTGFNWYPPLKQGLGPRWILIVVDWSRVLIARDLVVGARLTSSSNPLTIFPYHPNFVAQKFGLSQHVPTPHDSMVVERTRKKILPSELTKLLTGQEATFFSFSWGTNHDQIGETTDYVSWWRRVCEHIFPFPLTDYLQRYLGSVEGISIQPHRWQPEQAHQLTRPPTWWINRWRRRRKRST